MYATTKIDYKKGEGQVLADCLSCCISTENVFQYPDINVEIFEEMEICHS